MRILLATIIDNINYGTYLQALATVRLLEREGARVTVLNYERPHLNACRQLKKAFKSGMIGGLKSLPFIVIDRFEKRNVNKFLKGKCRFTRRFTDWNSGSSEYSGYDLYLTGSDQVWNANHNHGLDPVFFFKGIKGDKKSYAASIGTDTINPEYADAMRGLLESYSFISLREGRAVEALREIGVDGGVSVIDPTLMLDKEEWSRISKSAFEKTEPYLLVYSVEKERNAEVLKIARQIAKRENLKVYMVSPYPNRSIKKNVDRLFSLADTDTFLKLFENADYCVVSSFHGTAFAINFNRQFVTVSPEKFNSRVKNLLNLVGLEKRYINDCEGIPREIIKYGRINNILDREREKAAKIIQGKILRPVSGIVNEI